MAVDGYYSRVQDDTGAAARTQKADLVNAALLEPRLDCSCPASAPGRPQHTLPVNAEPAVRLPAQCTQ